MPRGNRKGPMGFGPTSGRGRNKDGLSFLSESMRIELENLEQMSFENVTEICENLRNRRTRRYLIQLHKEFCK